MAEVIVDQNISNEELLDVKQSLHLVIDYYQQKALDNAIEDESTVLVPVRATVEGFKYDNRTFKTTLTDYENFTLDHVKKGKNINQINNFSEVGEVAGNFTVTPEIYESAKEDTDFYMKAMSAQKTVIDTPTTTDIPTSKINFNPAKTGISLPAKSEYEYKESTYDKSFKNHILEECFPCLERTLSAIDSFEPKSEITNLVGRAVGQYKLYGNYLENLLFNDDLLSDLCNVANFLNSQCVPDLAGLLAFLTLATLKWKDVFNLYRLPITALISPLFGPILNGLASLLDRYLKLIMAPIDCIVSSLDNIITKIDLEQGVEDSKALVERDHINRAKELEARSAQIEFSIAKLQREKNQLAQSSGNQDRIKEIDNELVKEYGVDGDGNLVENGKLIRTREEIARERASAQKIRKEIATSGPTNLQEAKEQLHKSRSAIGSGLKDMKDVVLKSSNFVLGKLQLLIDEATKLVDLKVDNGLSQLEVARNLQRIARIATIIKTIIDIQTKGVSLCEDGADPKSSLGSFMRNIKPNAGMPQVFTASLDGEPQLVVLPPDAALAIHGIEEVQSTTDIKNYNKSGVVSDLGDLADQQITAIIPETQTQVQPTIVPLDLCGKKGDSGAKNRIKNWVDNLNV